MSDTDFKAPLGVARGIYESLSAERRAIPDAQAGMVAGLQALEQRVALASHRLPKAFMDGLSVIKDLNHASLGATPAAQLSDVGPTKPTPRGGSGLTLKL